MGFQNGGEEKKRRGKVREGACWPVTPYLTSSCNKGRLGTKGAILMHVQNEAATFSSLPPPPLPCARRARTKDLLAFPTPKLPRQTLLGSWTVYPGGAGQASGHKTHTLVFPLQKDRQERVPQWVLSSACSSSEIETVKQSVPTTRLGWPLPVYFTYPA